MNGDNRLVGHFWVVFVLLMHFVFVLLVASVLYGTV